MWHLGRYLQVREDGDSSSIIYTQRSGQLTELEFNDSGLKINGVSVATGTGSDIGKYSSTFNLGAGEITSKTTTVATEPYHVLLLDSDDNVLDVTGAYFTVVGGVYVFNMYSTDALTNVKLKILY